MAQIQSSIPKTSKQIIKNRDTNSTIENTVTLKICINNQYKDIQKTKCKDFYWHLMKSTNHNPRSKLTWSKTFKDLSNQEESTWKNRYNMSFKTVRETKIQTIQYCIIHRIIPCNEWLHNIKIRDNNKCNFCPRIDNISHFCITCPQNKIFLKSWSTWWNSLCNTDISQCNNAEGFGGNEDFIHTLNFSILIAKQYIYYQRLQNESKIDFLSYLPILKNKLQIEKVLCAKENNHNIFNRFKFIFEDL